MEPLAPDDCYRALLARDPRFDGVFFTGVETTGIYCRPVCPARTPARARCQFFQNAAQAEAAGFRACFRCRPERAPGTAPIDASAHLAHRAVTRIAAGALDGGSVDDLARGLGVTARHLRRAVESSVGVSPIALAQTRRLGLATWLVQDTILPLTQVAFASGFTSLRRFNAAFRERFGCPPTAIRRRGRQAAAAGQAVTLRLEARAPFAGRALLAFLAARAVPGVEEVTSTTYRRFACVHGRGGWIAAELDAARPGLLVRIDAALLPEIGAVVARLRALFDLDARPDCIDAHLGIHPVLAPLVAKVPGIRVPGAFDPWELAVRAVLGQQVSVRAATTLTTRLVHAFGAQRTAHAPAAAEAQATAAPGTQGNVLRGAWSFPSPATIASKEAEELQVIGAPKARVAALVALARAVAEGGVDLSPDAPTEAVVQSLLALPGIGPWTALYVAMRGLRDPDVFLATDLVVRRVLGVAQAKEAEVRSAPWRPWRSYALMHLWTTSTPTATDTRSRRPS